MFQCLIPGFPQAGNILPGEPSTAPFIPAMNGAVFFYHVITGNPEMSRSKILLVANTAWNLWNYRRKLILALERHGHELVLAAPDDRFREQLESLPHTRFVALRQLSRRSFSPLGNIRLLLELYRLLRREQADVAVFYTIKPNLLGNIAARWAGTPAVSVVEGLGYSGSMAARWRWLAAPLYRIALRRTCKVLFLNPDDALEFLQHHLIRESQSVIVPGPGVDTEYFQGTIKTDTDHLVFLFCGRLLLEKGIREFVAAARQIRQLDSRAIFRVLGTPDPGNPSSVALEELQAWEQEGVVEFLGPKDDVRPVLARSDVLVLPTYYREGVPRSVLEAMSMQMIIITTDTPGCRDTVTAGKNGYLIPPRQVDALIQAMQKILQLSPEQRRAMGAYSRKVAVNRFSDEQVLPQYLKWMEAVAAARKSKHTPRQSRLP